MHPSRKRQSTPPISSSPVKRALVSLPEPAHSSLPVIASRDGSPEPTDFEAAASGWSKDLASNLQLLLRPLADGSLPFATDSGLFTQTLARARHLLHKAASLVDDLLAKHGVSANCDQATQTEPEPAPTGPSIVFLPPPPTQPASSDAPGPDPPPRSYAHVTQGILGGPKTPRARHPKPKARGHAPTDPVTSPVRLIVRPPLPDEQAPPASFAVFFAKGPSEPFRRLSHALSLSPSTKNVALLGVHRNQCGNMVISLTPGTPDGAIARVTHVAKSVFAIEGSVPAIQRDVPWSKFLVSSVPSRPELNAPVYSEADLLASLLQNPLVTSLKITRSPRWIRNPASITGFHSSFTFAFEDPDGSLSKSLSKSSIFVLGGPVRLKRWVEKSKR